MGMNMEEDLKNYGNPAPTEQEQKTEPTSMEATEEKEA